MSEKIKKLFPVIVFLVGTAVFIGAYISINGMDAFSKTTAVDSQDGLVEGAKDQLEAPPTTAPTSTPTVAQTPSPTVTVTPTKKVTSTPIPTVTSTPTPTTTLTPTPTTTTPTESPTPTSTQSGQLHTYQKYISVAL